MYLEEVVLNAAAPTEIFKLFRVAGRGYLDLGSLCDKREKHCNAGLLKLLYYAQRL